MVEGTHLVALGAPLLWPGPRGPHVQLVALHRTFTGHPVRLASPPHFLVHSCPLPLRPDPALFVAVGAHANPEVRSTLQIFQESLRSTPFTLSWDTTVFRPGASPEDHGGASEPVLLHSLRLHSMVSGTLVPDAALGDVAHALASLPSSSPPYSRRPSSRYSTLLHAPPQPMDKTQILAPCTSALCPCTAA